MSIITAIIIGLVQGLTEFLPISSSGHMLIAGRLIGAEVSLAFELVMHLATLLAVITVMRRDVYALIKKPLGKNMRLIICGTIPTVIIVFLLKERVEKTFDGAYLPYFFIITAIMLLLSGFIKNPKKQIGYLDALIIGSVQGIAAFPGISRSGSTISTGVLLGNQRDSAARFSFLLSIPVILGSSIIEIASNGLGEVSVLPLVFGFVFAFLSGYFALRFMLSRLKGMFDYFAIYLLALSILLLLNDFFLHWF